MRRVSCCCAPWPHVSHTATDHHHRHPAAAPFPQRPLFPIPSNCKGGVGAQLFTGGKLFVKLSSASPKSCLGSLQRTWSAMILLPQRPLAAENHISGALNELQCLAYPSKPLIIACERGGIDTECIGFPWKMLPILPCCELPD